MTDWDITNLGDVISHQKGFAFKSGDFTNSGCLVVRVSNFTAESIDVAECSFLSNENAKLYEAVRLLKGDVVIATVGSWETNPASIVGKVIRVPSKAEGALLNQNAVRLRANKLITQEFLYYLLKNKIFSNYIVKTAQGSANQASITLRDIFNFKFYKPPIEEQKAIAKVLSSLDDKIELNRRMNATLEAIARALFKAWFVDFEPVHANMGNSPSTSASPEIVKLFPSDFENGIPKGWHVGTLSEIATNYRQNIDPSEIDADTHYVGLEHIPRKSLALTEWGTASKAESTKSEFRANDILFGKLRPYFHKVVIAPVDGICSTDILVIRPKEKRLFGQTLMEFSCDEIIQYADKLSNGAKMPRTNWKDLALFETVLASDPVSEQFSAIVSTIGSKLVRNIEEAKTLAALRDSLLPRLISGKLRVGVKAMVQRTINNSILRGT